MVGVPRGGRILALIGEALGQAAGQGADRVGIVHVVAVSLPGHLRVERVVDVVVPLGGTEAPIARGRAEKARLVRVVLEHDVYGPRGTRPRVRGVDDLVDDVHG